MKSLYESILSSTGVGRSNFEVDLGLSVNWCAYNVGANKPEEAGLYFAWGDTTGYKESEIKKKMFTKEWYSKLPASKINTDLDLQHDAAHEYFKGKWHMPTLEEFKDLKENTKQTVEVLNGIKGIRFTAKNGNSIFIPFVGGSYKGDVLGTGKEFNCWSSEIDNEESAYIFGLGSGISIVSSKGDRYLGVSVRAVCDK